MPSELIVIGGGLAASEAAWQAARKGLKVLLFDWSGYLEKVEL